MNLIIVLLTVLSFKYVAYYESRYNAPVVSNLKVEFNYSNFQLFNCSTIQVFNYSSFQLFNSSTLQLFKFSTIQLFNN